MPRETLRENLQKLHEELASTSGGLDEETRVLLRGVADDIEHVLGEKSVESESVRGRMEHAALKFESEHPRLAGILSDVTDALTKLGI